MSDVTTHSAVLKVSLTNICSFSANIFQYGGSPRAISRFRAEEKLLNNICTRLTEHTSTSKASAIINHRNADTFALL